MADFILSCCSTVDMDAAFMAERKIEWVPFHFMIDGVDHLDDQKMPMKEFYDLIRKGAITKTSQVSTGEFVDYFTPYLEKGYDILHVCLSTGLSGVYNAACIARDDLAARFPERKIRVVDSLCASSGYGLLMDTLADLRDDGMGLDALYAWVQKHRLGMRHWFFSTDLSCYVRGGRLSKAAGLVGSMLHLCPLLEMNDEGKLTPRQKLRGKNNAIRRIVDMMEQTAQNGTEYSGKCFISQSDCIDDAHAVADLIEARFPRLDGHVHIFDIGTTIGSHTGPGTIALFFWGTDREP